jgi:hypothetical protein
LQFAGEYIKTWRRRWFVLKEGHIFWFKENYVSLVKDPIASKLLKSRMLLLPAAAFLHDFATNLRQNCIQTLFCTVTMLVVIFNALCKGFVNDMRFHLSRST